MDYLIGALSGVLVAVLQGSFFEWVFHRYWMHRPGFVPRLPYLLHDQTHHRVCGGSHYLATRPEQEEGIGFTGGGGALMIVVNVLPWLFVVLLLGALATPLWFGALVGHTLGFCAYYLAYEVLHERMHKPRGAAFERTWWFRALDAHHRGHHRASDRNLNVVLPLADWLFGTLTAASQTSGRSG